MTQHKSAHCTSPAMAQGIPGVTPGRLSAREASSPGHVLYLPCGRSARGQFSLSPVPRFPSPISYLSQLVTWLPGIQRKSKSHNKNLLDFLTTNIQTPGTHKALPFLLLKMKTVPSCCLGIQPALTSPTYPLPGSVRGGGDMFNLSTCLYSSLSPCPISSALNHIQVYHPTTNLNLTSPPSYYPLTFSLSLHCPTSRTSHLSCLVFTHTLPTSVPMLSPRLCSCKAALISWKDQAVGTIGPCLAPGQHSACAYSSSSSLLLVLGTLSIFLLSPWPLLGLPCWSFLLSLKCRGPGALFQVLFPDLPLNSSPSGLITP